MLKSERESSVAGGQSITTEAGESPREAKHLSSVALTSKTPPSGGNELLPTSTPSAPPSVPTSDADANQQPAPALPKSTNDATGGVATSKAGESSGLVPKAPATSTNDNTSISTQRSTTKRPVNSLESGASSHFVVASPVTADASLKHVIPIAARKNQSSPAVAVSSNATAHASAGSDIRLLALGHQGAPPNNRTRPLAPAASHVASKIQIPVVSNAGQAKGKNLRRGKWTVEEEAYVARVIQDFNSGFLNAPAGTTLRSYLSEKLQCDPMRITKKFTGDSCIGKRVFHPAVRNPSNAAAIDKAQAELDALERRWRRRLEMQQRESAKKAAASAAAAAAASGRSHGFITQSALGANFGGAAAGHAGVILGGGQSTTAGNGVTQTATWLDRASNILKAGSQPGVSVPCSQQQFSLTQEQAKALQSLPKKEIEMQMKEVERLIHEGPIIQQTTAGLPMVLHQPSSTVSPPPPVPTTIVASTPVAPPSDGQQTPPEPADKRMRTGAEDAEALVGFLTAVRASAAAGTDSFSA